MLKGKQIPHTYVIIFGFIILAAILTMVLPGGEYVEKTSIVDGKETTEMVFKQTENQAQTWQIFSALFKGFEVQAGIIVFILMIGGAFWIMNESKAIDVGIITFLRSTRKLEHNGLIKFLGVNNIIITLIMLLFSAFGAIFGMSEETIAFVIIMVPLSISMGYDSIVGISMCFVAAGLGFAGAILNPFTIGIAQGIAEIPLFSGIEYRMFCWLVINIVGIWFVLRYAKKVKKNPEISPVYDSDEYWRKRGSSELNKLEYYTPKAAWVSFILVLSGLLAFSWYYPSSDLKFGDVESGTGTILTFPFVPLLTGLFALSSIFALRKSVHFFILNLLAFTILFLNVGVMGYAWYIEEIATLFFAMGLFSGIAINKSANDITQLFILGMKDILTAAVVVGLAGGIIMILQDGKVINTILHGLSKSMNDFGNIASISIMYLIQTVINIVIPSGSAKAALTMPIMAPFSDLIGISRQATVMAFQFGDGFTNMITPTSGVLIGVLGVAKIPYDRWLKWVTPFIIILMIVGFLLLIPTVTMELNGF